MEQTCYMFVQHYGLVKWVPQYFCYLTGLTTFGVEAGAYLVL